MPTKIEEFEKWLEFETELDWLEFKEAKASLGTDDALEYCVGIANVGGGKLVLGVSNRKPRRIVGSGAFNNIAGIEEKIFERVKIHVRVEEFGYEEKRLLIFHIPGRPHGRAYSLDGRYVIRVGQRLVTMTDDQLRAIHGEGKPDWLSETAKSDLAEQEVFGGCPVFSGDLNGDAG